MSLILKKESSLCLSCMNQMKIRLNDRLHDDFVLFYVLVPIHMFSWWCWHLSLHFLSNAINQSARTFTQSQGAKCCCIHCCLEVLRGQQIKHTQTVCWLWALECGPRNEYYVQKLSVKCTDSTNFYTFKWGKVLLYRVRHKFSDS